MTPPSQTDPPPDDAPLADLVGVWELDDHTSALYIVPSADGEFPDFSAPGESGIVLSGDVEGILRYARPYQFSVAGATIAFADRPFEPGTGPSLVLELRSRAGRGLQTTLTATAADGSERTFTRFAAAVPSGGASTPEPVDGRIALSEPQVLTSGEDTVVVSGSLEFATKPVTAGAPTLFTSLESADGAPPPTIRYKVSADSTVVQSMDCGAAGTDMRIGALEGTEREGALLWGESEGCAGTFPTRVPYRLEGAVLNTSTVITEWESFYSLGDVGALYGIAGPMSQNEVRIEETFRRAD